MLRWLVPVVLLSALGCGDDGRVGGDASLDADARVDAPGDGGRVDTGIPTGAIPESEYPEALARVWCETRFDCDCESTAPDVESCVSGTAGALRLQGERFREMGLGYDDECASLIMRKIVARGCTALTRPIELVCEECNLYHGDVPRGDPCMVLGSSAANCQAGLSCLPPEPGTAPICEELCNVTQRFVPDGESCDPTGTVACDPLFSFCNDSDICEAHPGVGEPCDRGRCNGDAWCDDTGTCVALRPRGEPCDTGVECRTKACDEGVCGSFCWPQPF